MPELPEVETVRRDLTEVILDLPISQVEIRLPKIIKSPRAKFEKTLKANSFVKIERRGKFLIFQLGKGEELLLVHLRMTGQLIFLHKNHLMAGGHGQKMADIGELPNKHTHLIITFQDGDKLFFNDQRQFGTWEIIPKKQLPTRLKNLGVDVSTSNFTWEFLQEKAKNRKAPIKNFLLNQTVMTGLGNIYASEVLFESGISPLKKAESLSKTELKKLHAAVCEIIKRAIKARGTTFSDFVDGRGRSGGFSAQLKVFDREGESCPLCGTPIKKIKQAGRSTFFCPVCQK